jgi:hypothetical protein
MMNQKMYSRLLVQEVRLIPSRSPPSDLMMMCSGAAKNSMMKSQKFSEKLNNLKRKSEN